MLPKSIRRQQYRPPVRAREWRRPREAKAIPGGTHRGSAGTVHPGKLYHERNDRHAEYGLPLLVCQYSVH